MRDRKNRALFTLLAVLMIAALIVTGCSSSSTSDDESPEEEVSTEVLFPITVTDDAGREVTVETQPQRIVSLAPANTEIVAALGLMDKLVGVTTYCDYPPEVVDLPKMGDFIGPNHEAIAAAEPDLVLATTGVQAEAIVALEELGAVVVAVDPQTLEAVFDSIELIGEVTGANLEAAELTADMRADLDEVTEALGDADPITCFLEIAQDPLYTAGPGTLLHDLMAAAGGENFVSEEGYVGYSLEQLVTDDPDVYLATLGSMSDPSDIDSRAGYEKMSSVKAGKVFVLEDNLVSRPGPRVVEGVLQIAEALHPESF